MDGKVDAHSCAAAADCLNVWSRDEEQTTALPVRRNQGRFRSFSMTHLPPRHHIADVHPPGIPCEMTQTACSCGHGVSSRGKGSHRTSWRSRESGLGDGRGRSSIFTTKDCCLSCSARRSGGLGGHRLVRGVALKPSKRVRTQSLVKGSGRDSPPGATTPQPFFM